jgi:hypothetical protein
VFRLIEFVAQLQVLHVQEVFSSVLSILQLRQLVSSGPLHVFQLKLHGIHVELLLKNPSAQTHDLRSVSLYLLKHDTHWELSGPVQVLQEL